MSSSPPRLPKAPVKAPPQAFGVCSKLRGGGQCHLKLMDRSISKASNIRRFGIPEVRRIHGPNRRTGTSQFQISYGPKEASLLFVHCWTLEMDGMS